MDWQSGTYVFGIIFCFYVLFFGWVGPIKIFHASTVEGVSFSVALTATQEESLADAIRTDSLGIVPLLCQIDGSKATAQEASDLRMIQGAIARAGGMARLNASVMNMLRAWLLRALRKAQVGCSTCENKCPTHKT